jgi:hypothetical protein
MADYFQSDARGAAGYHCRSFQLSQFDTSLNYNHFALNLSEEENSLPNSP